MSSQQWERPAAGYTGEAGLLNRTKWETDSNAIPKVAISSVKMDGDMNFVFDVLNTIFDYNGGGAAADLPATLISLESRTALNTTDIATVNALTGGGAGQTTLANTLTDFEGRVAQNETDIGNIVAGMVPDGDYGDITISVGGTVYTIDADAVTTAKILDANVTTAKIADLNVTEGKIANDAVTLAKMAAGTAQNIVGYNASGDPEQKAEGTGINITDGSVAVDVGTGANQIVQLDGTSKLPAVDGSQLTNLPDVSLSDVFFDAHATADQSIGTSATKIQFPTEDRDSGTVYDPTTNYRFTAPRDGEFFLYAGVTFNPAGVVNCQVGFKVNGAGALKRTGYHSGTVSTARVQVCASGGLSLSSGDYVEVFGVCSTSTNTDAVDTFPEHVHFGGFNTD